MKSPRSRFLTHPYPMYRGCDLIELLWLGLSIILGLVLVCGLFAFVTGWSQWWVKLIELIFSLPVGIVVFRVSTAQIAELKKDKPPHYLLNRLSQRLGVGKTGRITRCGDWECSRTIDWKEKD